MTNRLRRLADSTAVHMMVAFLAMGGWAIFANRSHPMQQSLLAGIVQGALSALLTLFLKSAIERLSKLFGGAAVFFAPPAIAIAMSATLLAAVHFLAGTPEITRTIALPLLVSSTYAATYNLALHRKEHPAP